MPRWSLLMLVSAMTVAPMAAPLHAQLVQPQRFAAPTTMVTDTVPATGRQPLPPGFVTQQAFAGFAGFTIGALAGGLIGAQVAPNDGGGFSDLAGVIYGLAIGGALGSSITVYRFSNAKGYRSSYAATLVGSIAGFFGGPLLWVTVPIGSTVGYNVARK
jgi:hypothetical protein